LLARAAERVPGLDALKEKTIQRLDALNHSVREYRHSCWPVNSLDYLKLGPFHLLASEGAVHTDKRLTWRMETLAQLCAADEPLLLATHFQIVDLNDSTSCNAATAWWTDMTAAGREGMVVKPLDSITKGRRDLSSPPSNVAGRNT
jgi:protein phosphatase